MSRGRLTNQLYHGSIDDRDEELHHHVHRDAQTPDLTSRLHRTRAEQPLTPELIHIAAEWREVAAQIDAIDVPRQQALLRTRDQLDQTRRMLTGNLERLRTQLQQETNGLRRPKRRHRGEELRAEHDRTTTELENVSRQMQSMDRVMAHEGLPDRRQLGALFRRRERLDDELRRAAATRVQGYRADTPEHLAMVLGEPPTDSRAHERWEHIATQIEHHRLRWNITDPTDPLGDRTLDPRTRLDRAALRHQVRRTADELAHGAVRQRAMRLAR